MRRFSLRTLVAGFFLTAAAVADSASVEKRRQELCKLLLVGNRCEPAMKLFGPPPAGSVVEFRRAELCRENACVLSNMKLPPDLNSMPKGSYVNVRQTVTVIAGNGLKKEWKEGHVIFYWEGDSIEISDRSTSYSVEFDQAHQYFWIRSSFYEGGSDEWVSYKTGKSYPFNGHPNVSPDGQHILVTEGDYELIKLYSLTKSSITPVAEFDIAPLLKKVAPLGGGSGAPFWINSSEIAIFYHFQKNAVIARIKNQGNKWSLHVEGQE